MANLASLFPAGAKPAGANPAAAFLGTDLKLVIMGVDAKTGGRRGGVLRALAAASGPLPRRRAGSSAADVTLTPAHRATQPNALRHPPDPPTRRHLAGLRGSGDCWPGRHCGRSRCVGAARPQPDACCHCHLRRRSSTLSAPAPALTRAPFAHPPLLAGMMGWAVPEAGGVRLSGTDGPKEVVLDGVMGRDGCLVTRVSNSISTTSSSSVDLTYETMARVIGFLIDSGIRGVAGCSGESGATTSGQVGRVFMEKWPPKH